MKLLTSVGNEITELDLGRVKVGESKEFNFFLFNEHNSHLEEIAIKFEAVKDSDTIEILKIPEVLGPKAKGTVKIRWTPTLEIQEGLKTKVIVTALEIWG